MLAGRLKNQAQYLGDKTIDNCEKEIAELNRIILVATAQAEKRACLPEPVKKFRPADCVAQAFVGPGRRNRISSTGQQRHLRSDKN